MVVSGAGCYPSGFHSSLATCFPRSPLNSKSHGNHSAESTRYPLGMLRRQVSRTDGERPGLSAGRGKRRGGGRVRTRWRGHRGQPQQRLRRVRRAARHPSQDQLHPAQCYAGCRVRAVWQWGDGEEVELRGSVLVALGFFVAGGHRVKVIGENRAKVIENGGKI